MKYFLTNSSSKLAVVMFVLLTSASAFGAVNKEVSASPSIFTNFLFDLLLVTALVLLLVILSMGRVIRDLLEAGEKKINSGNTFLSFLALISFSLIAVDANAQTELSTGATSSFLGVPDQIGGIDAWILIGLVFIICAELIIILVLTRTVKRIMLGLGFQPEPLIKEQKPWINWSLINRKLTDSVPVESEESILTNHNYDGIHELDNNLPPWWKYGFYLTIAFAIYYMLDYHVFKISPLQLDEYKTELVNAEIEKKARLSEMAANIDESTVVRLNDENALAQGEDIFEQNCVACHGKFGEGGVGPNFTDEYWIHGGGIKEVFTTIKYGVPAKGMISWQNQLTPEAMQKVSSYILAFQGTHPANPKAPQGEMWKELPGPPVDTIAK